MDLRTAWGGSALALALVLGAAHAGAQAPSGVDPVLAARTVGYEGIAAYQAGDYALAERKLNHAYRLLPVPSLGLWSARTLAKLQRLVEASARYTEVTRSMLLAGDADVQRQAKAEAEQELAALLPRIPALQLRLDGARWDEVHVWVDGIERSVAAREGALPVNPGERLIQAQRGAQQLTQRVTAVEAQSHTLVLRFAPSAAVSAATVAPPPGPVVPAAEATAPVAAPRGADDPWRTVGWVGVGVGGSALLLSGVAGLVAWSKLDDFDCSTGPCTSSDRDAVDGYNSLVTASTVGYLAGGVLAGAGALLLLREQLWGSDVEVGVGARSVTVSGRF